MTSCKGECQTLTSNDTLYKCEECFDTLLCYVYRLIDPRDNKTFYVGKGKDNRGWQRQRQPCFCAPFLSIKNFQAFIVKKEAPILLFIKEKASKSGII